MERRIISVLWPGHYGLAPRLQERHSVLVTSKRAGSRCKIKSRSDPHARQTWRRGMEAYAWMPLRLSSFKVVKVLPRCVNIGEWSMSAQVLDEGLLFESTATRHKWKSDKTEDKGEESSHVNPSHDLIQCEPKQIVEQDRRTKSIDRIPTSVISNIKYQ